jgi:thiol:disulfide interchange protein
MRKILILFMLSCSLVAAAQNGYVMPEMQVKFSSSTLEGALNQAKVQNKMLFVFFYNPNIGACRLMGRRTFSNDTIVDFLEKNFVSIKINTADSLNKSIVSKYDVDEYELLFLDSKGHVKYRFGGGMNFYDVPFFMEQAKQALSFKDRSVKEGVNFRAITLATALQTALKEKKVVFVDCYTKWCGPCAQMANTVFPTKQLGDLFNPKFVSLKMNMETPEGLAMNKKYKVTSYPTFLILDPNGKEIGRILGGMSAQDLISKVNQYIKLD